MSRRVKSCRVVRQFKNGANVEFSGRRALQLVVSLASNGELDSAATHASSITDDPEALEAWTFLYRANANLQRWDEAHSALGNALRIGAMRAKRLLLTGHSHQAWPDVAREGVIEADRSLWGHERVRPLPERGRSEPLRQEHREGLAV